MHPTCFQLLATALTVRGQQPNVSLGDHMVYVMAPLDFTEVTSGFCLTKDRLRLIA